jgi:hypothetical protein
MSAASAMARGRALAESLMADTCTITRPTTVTTNPNTGQVIKTTTTVYSGSCRIQQRTTTASEEHTGEQYTRMARFELQLPMSATGLNEADTVTITASAHDPDLAGRVFKVRDLAHGTHKTARRVGIEEET